MGIKGVRRGRTVETSYLSGDEPNGEPFTLTQLRGGQSWGAGESNRSRNAGGHATGRRAPPETAQDVLALTEQPGSGFGTPPTQRLPVPPRRGFLTKEACGLPQGGEVVATPSAKVAAGKGWRNAVDLRHLPEGTHCLANRPGPLVRLTFQKWSAWQDSHPISALSGLHPKHARHVR
jgi:hypothetical protein